jgi:hypothetical protein
LTFQTAEDEDDARLIRQSLVILAAEIHAEEV